MEADKKIKDFIDAVNKELMPVANIVMEREIGNHVTFNLEVAKSKYFSRASFIKSSEFYRLIESLGVEYFDSKVEYNNTSNIFWFFIGEGQDD
jgi:hypothetical protein